jgi:hypothetical protein
VLEPAFSFQSSKRGQSFKKKKQGRHTYTRTYCFNPLNEAHFLKEHLHFTIDFLGRQGAVLHTPANPVKNKLLLCKLDGFDEIVKCPKP